MEQPAAPAPLLLESGPYQIILADPPYPYLHNRGIRFGSAASHYPLLPIIELQRLPVSNLADGTTAALFLWTTGPMMKDALQLMTTWGFSYKTVFLVWIKTCKYDPEKPRLGMGYYSRSAAEFLLLGVRGNVIPWKASHRVEQVLAEPPREHSRKPDEARRRIEEFFGLPQPHLKAIELFAREQSPGWDAWGLETNRFSQ